jgi:hypothetical protein
MITISFGYSNVRDEPEMKKDRSLNGLVAKGINKGLRTLGKVSILEPDDADL